MFVDFAAIILEIKASIEEILPGAAYPMVPFNPAVLVSLAEKSELVVETNFANPKSLTRATISLSRRTLLGFKSRWMIGGSQW